MKFVLSSLDRQIDGMRPTLLLSIQFINSVLLEIHFLHIFSVITMIGYGDTVPRTKKGKIGIMIYACIGIPVYILYFTNMGKVFSRMLKWVHTKVYRWSVKRKWRQSVNFEGLGSAAIDEEDLDEAYLDELEQQV